MKTAIIGGGAAGFFTAINLKEMMPDMEVVIFERGNRVLAKVEISGGGRCNCTNSFASVRDLSHVYPRGHRLMKRLMKQFDQRDAYEWFERRGVTLTTQADECVFPASQDSHSIINCFLNEAERLGVRIRKGMKINSLENLVEYDYVVVTTGGMPRSIANAATDGGLFEGVEIVPPVPSLFTFNIADEALRGLMGTVVEGVTVMIPGTKMRASGPLLVTHWGMSGPAILKLSSYAARLLAEHGYRMPLIVNWTGRTEEEVREELMEITMQNPNKQLANVRPFGLPSRLWNYLLEKSLGERSSSRWIHLNKKELNRLVNVLQLDTYEINGRAAFKDEFVTCGGVSLGCLNASTLEFVDGKSPRRFFAGEVLDVDGVTGGFNFQAAWTTGFAVAKAIAGQ
ncbi:MAG: aminoacetone oxidase family FAD-binding enzyme [Prevotella sp.]|nr:aminoacetone oxidase family FAD-binding enzyme [Prevotella sp.]